MINGHHVWCDKCYQSDCLELFDHLAHDYEDGLQFDWFYFWYLTPLSVIFKLNFITCGGEPSIWYHYFELKLLIGQ
jgi:hypothetical protein